MRKNNIMLIISLSFISLIHSQNQINSEKLPELIPPSPTVSALMKYEEIPVSNYTGVPKISIPLFNYKFPSNNIEVNIGLSYHSASTKLDEVASDIGLGWSLTCGGSISRNVRDMPDESIKTDKFGIYRTNPINGINYYQTLLWMLNNNLISDSASISYGVVNETTQDNLKEFIWDKDAKGKYDTQHDLWQYNFNGNSGRFYIEKQSNGNLEVKLLEDSKLKIVNHYNLPNQSISVAEYFKPIGFTIYDELGYKYVFDVVEVTVSNQLSETTSQNDIMNMSNSSETYNSAFHLSKVYDRNNKLLIEYSYFNSGSEHIVNSSLTSYFPMYNINIGNEISQILSNFTSLLGQDFILGLYKPKSMVSISDNTYLPKKLQEIQIKGIGKVIFNYQKGREDDDYVNRTEVDILKNILVKDSANNIIKNFSLEHEYKNAVKKKLFLKKVKQNDGNNSIDIYDLYYKEPSSQIVNPIKDYWGYLKNNDEINFGFNRETDKDLVTMFALEKMVLPTKGCVVFDYESNTYSSIGNEQLTDFDENPYNWNTHNTLKVFNTITNNTTAFFTLTEAQKVLFIKEINFQTNDWSFNIYKDYKSPSNLVGAVSSYSTPNNYDYYTLPLVEGNYYVEFIINDFNGQTINSKITAIYKSKKTNDYNNIIYGGGFRIASISTYNQNVNVNNVQIEPLSKKYYNYNKIDNQAYSSGILVSKKPVFQFDTSVFRPELRVTLQGTTPLIFLETIHNYNVFTNYDKISRDKTQGSDIGYKNVIVYNLNNGRSEYTYTSSLEYPNLQTTIEPLFLPSVSMDYKRGLLEKEVVFDKSNNIISSKIYNYNFEDNLKITGLYIFGTYDYGYNSCPAFKLFTNYNEYKIKKADNCVPASLACTIDYNYNTFKEDLNIGFSSFLESYGWAKLASKNTKEYFYPSNSSNPSILETNETYTYNPINKQIAESTVTNSNGEILKTNYYYHTGNSIHTQNRISEIEKVETFRNGVLLNTSKINYANNWGSNVSYLPQTIQSSKGANSLETKIKYNKYDEFSNPQEVQQENGTKICYIWGYNKTQPVAKIENIAYASIPANLITAIETASNSGTEASLITALNNLRNAPALANAMVTTYTYKPLIGVSTITDPKGDTITYHYDGFNRLEKVTDKTGNILSENEYHYRE